MPIVTSSLSGRGSSFIEENLRTLPVATSTTLSLPSVIVPVLSEKSSDSEPAVSKPLILCTSTLSFAMRILW